VLCWWFRTACAYQAMALLLSLGAAKCNSRSVHHFRIHKQLCQETCGCMWLHFRRDSTLCTETLMSKHHLARLPVDSLRSKEFRTDGFDKL
jgi:hypothetical protein